MTTKAAKTDVLGELHAKVADVMLKALDGVEVQNKRLAELHAQQKAEADDPSTIADQPVLLEPSAALLNAITKFLKDNEITCNDDAPSMQPLAEKVQEQRAGKKPTVASKIVLEDLPLTEAKH